MNIEFLVMVGALTLALSIFILITILKVTKHKELAMAKTNQDFFNEFSEHTNTEVTVVKLQNGKTIKRLFRLSDNQLLCVVTYDPTAISRKTKTKGVESYEWVINPHDIRLNAPLKNTQKLPKKERVTLPDGTVVSRYPR